MMVRPARPHLRNARGFTLMEMMIAMALIGMALTIAFAALRFASRSWERTAELGAEFDQLRIATQVVRRQLAQVQAIKPDETKRELLFHGGSQTLEFVAPAPVQDGRLAALYHYRLRFGSDEQGTALVLEYRPYRPGETQAWQGEVDSSLLAGGLQGGRFSYYPATPLQAGSPWQPQWDKPEQLPRMVRMELQLPGQTQPWPAVVAVLPVTGSVR
jgi:general secretion pathway protein J